MSFKDAIASVAAQPAGAVRHAAAMVWAEQIAATTHHVPLRDLLGVSGDLHADVSAHCQTARGYNVLQSCGLADGSDLLKRTVPDVWNLRQCGTKTVLDIFQALLVAAAGSWQPATPLEGAGKSMAGLVDPAVGERALGGKRGEKRPHSGPTSWAAGYFVETIADMPIALRKAPAQAWAEQIMAHEGRTPLRDVFGMAGTLPHLDVSRFCKTTRAFNILHFNGLADLAVLVDRSVQGLLALKNCGMLTVMDIIQATLLAAASRWAEDALARRTASSALGSHIADSRDAMDDSWRSEPAWTAADVSGLFGEWISRLNDREVSIVRNRLLGRCTLDDLGREFGVTRQRVRQIERRVLGKLDVWRVSRAPSAAVMSLEGEIRRAVVAVAGEQRLLAQVNDLAVRVPGLEFQVLDLVPLLIPSIVRQGQWIAIRSLADLQDETVASLSDSGSRSVEQITATREQLGLTAEEWPRWLEHCGLRVIGGAVVRSGAGIAEAVTAVLNVAGHPMSADDIAAKLGASSVQTVRNRLTDDPRIVRVAPNLYALPEWGLETYEGIREEIAQRIERGGGRVRFDKLVDELVSQFGVSPNSVLAYASGREFARKGGWVFLADARQVRTERAPLRRDTPAATRRCYFHGGRWWFRVDVGADALRGSGFPAPVGIMRLFQVAEGTERTFSADGTVVRITWVRNQPAFGTLRSLLLSRSAEPGDALWLSPADAHRMDARLTRAPEIGVLSTIAHLTGAQSSEDADVMRKKVAEAAGLPTDKSWAVLAQVLNSRGDSDVAALIEQLLPVGQDTAPTLDEFFSALRGQR